MAKSREIEVFGLSFMDLISCGLGGMLVLMIVFSTLVNADGVATPVKAESANKSVAELERELIFNTYFTLKVVLDDASISINPVNHVDIITAAGRDNNGAKTEHIFMIYGTNKVVGKMSFSIDGGTPEGTAQLLGEQAQKIPSDCTRIEVIKDKTNYHIKFRS